MKIKLHCTLLLFSLLFFNNLYSQTTYVPDNAFEQYLIDEGYDDVLDDFVITANIENVTILNINFLSIVDLTGIEDFTALTHLHAQDNLNLSSLDVSQNTELTVLYAHNTLISSLDLSTNTELIELNLFRTSISSLDLSQNTALTTLNVSQTSLSSLDVSMNTALITLSASVLSIPSLDVSNNTALIELYVSDTSLSTIDVSANTELEYLIVNDALIPNLDVSINTALIWLSINNNNLLNSLDVSTNTLLTNLFVTNTPNLDCITVADEEAATAGTGIYSIWEIDVTCSYSEDCDALSVSEFEASKVFVGPNPVKDELQIILNNVAVLNNVELFDITGKLILTTTNSNISTSQILSGLYLVKITTDKGSFTKKLVKY